MSYARIAGRQFQSSLKPQFRFGRSATLQSQQQQEQQPQEEEKKKPDQSWSNTHRNAHRLAIALVVALTLRASIVP